MWIAIVLVAVVLILAALFVVPRSRNADDGPLPSDVETQILLGENPDQTTAEIRRLPSPTEPHPEE